MCIQFFMYVLNLITSLVLLIKRAANRWFKGSSKGYLIESNKPWKNFIKLILRGLKTILWIVIGMYWNSEKIML